jgi:protein-S-isoprenylcysteine O-methyltransferase Ste14
MVLFALFLFHGSLNVVNLGLSETERLWLNACLSLAFFIQHSVMIRRQFRQRLAQFIRVEYHGALFTIISGVVLLIIVVFWQKSANTLAAPQDILRWLMHAVYFLSIPGFVWGIRSLGTFDPFGFSPILYYMRGKNEPQMPFFVRGPYCWVRHPLYLFSLLMIWSCPNLTADRLLFNVLWTAWIIAGAVFEERDLVASYGEAYRNYQSKVPMLIPYRIRPCR